MILRTYLALVEKSRGTTFGIRGTSWWNSIGINGIQLEFRIHGTNFLQVVTPSGKVTPQ